MTTTAYDPLRTPEPDGAQWVPPLDIALESARETLAEQQRANIYDDRAMLGAAVRLEIALRQLLTALDAEAGR
ncbi:hypothetical protein [Streptomyces sp. H27-S2]|uniref:hypothetical protein n=1 Tax=Streptomyces antarcticus TaxID=2996458 RepID=UPI0022713367|nr:hypothetical protein [Streptomyces sp. H27-S2]MCY0952107.1 hypothetical protein [Streptomyces sp. H27-S2]